MKSRLALLAVPFLALACSEAEQATLLEPPAISADVTIEAAPVLGTFTLTVFAQTNPCSGTVAVFNDPDWTIPAASPGGCIFLQISGYSGSKRGTIVKQQCISKSTGNQVSRSECANKTGAWKTVSKIPVNNLGRFASQQSVSVCSAEGVRLIFRGMGSGIKNRTIGPFDVIRECS